MNIHWQKIIPHTIVLLLFMVISVAYFSPILEGKKILQSDIVQYNGMAKERNDFRQVRESYWTNSAFGGMPTYQLGAQYPHNYIKSVDKIIRFLPRPADYLFLYFVGFYLLLLVLRADYRYAFLGALAFGFSTYLIIILGVGHNAKAHAIGYFSFVLAGIILLFQRKYVLGFLLTTLFMALEINANHFQMTYYLLFLIFVFVMVQLAKAIKSHSVRIYAKTMLVLGIAFVFSALLNATSLLATRQYADFSTRSKSELTLNPDGTHKINQNGLSKSYITEYSYGVLESLNLIVPRLFGGANAENLGTNSNVYQYLQSHNVPHRQALSFAQNLPTYWGEQPIVAAPAYVGIIMFFLCVLAFFVVRAELKCWLGIGIVLSLLLSWGKNFNIVTEFMIDYFPMYNKFRAVSSIQVILELCIPVLATLGLYHLVKKSEKENLRKPLYLSFSITAGILLLLLVFKGAFSFEGANDAFYTQMYGSELMEVIRTDRKQIYTSDILRNLLLLCIAFVVLWFFLNRKLQEKWMLVAFVALILFDMLGVSKRYVNSDSFVSASVLNRPFQLSETEQNIRNDKDVFRVFSVQEGLNGAKTSYFFHSIGGYHAAKPKRMQELFDYQIYKNNMQVLNMLNVRYLIFADDKNQPQVSRNPEALGNAWFVSNLKKVASADQEMFALDTINTSKTAVYQQNFAESHIANHFFVDSLATIKLEKYAPDRLEYVSDNQKDGFAVFSEMYYKDGWIATIDGETEPIYRVNYALRGLKVPAGKHKIVFRFEPQIVKTGSYITLVSFLVLLLFVVGYFLKKKFIPLKKDEI